MFVVVKVESGVSSTYRTPVSIHRTIEEAADAVRDAVIAACGSRNGFHHTDAFTIIEVPGE